MDSHFTDRFLESWAISVSRRAALRGIGLAGVSAVCLGAFGPRDIGAAQPESLPPEWFRTADACNKDATCGRHGQVIIGEGPLYLAHLPMFMFDTPGNHPHHYQVITEVSLPGDAMATYLDDRQTTGAPLYTLRPTDTYRMLDLMLPSQSESPVQSLTGDVIRGHWERESEPQPFGIDFEAVETGVQVTVERVVYAHEFALHPVSLDRLEYVLFGSGEHLFLAHRITAAPDFDQILPVTIENGGFSDEQLREGIVLAIPERSNTLAERLMDGDQDIAEARHAATGAALTARDAQSGSPAAEGVQIAAGREFYFEEGELRFPLDFPADFAPTKEEIAAGFGFP